MLGFHQEEFVILMKEKLGLLTGPELIFLQLLRTSSV
jgi:hypothetical protein